MVDRPPPPQAPYPLANIPLEAESASITVRGMQAAGAGDQTTPMIEANLPNLSDEISARIDEIDGLLKSRPSLQLLAEQEQDWTAIHQKLINWQHALEDRGKLLRAQSVQLVGENGHGGLTQTWLEEQRLIDYWRQYASKENQSLLDKADKPVDRTLALIDSTAAQVRQSSIKVFSLEQDVNTQAAHAEEVLYNVRQARDQAFNQLLTRSDPVIWKISTGSRELVQQGQNSFMRQVQAVFAYLRQRWENVAVHAGVFVLLVAGLFFIRRKVNQWTKVDPGLKQATKVFCSPIATALALTFLLSIWIYPQAPRMFWAFVGAAALIPTIIILRGLIGRSLFPILNALVVFYFLDQVRAISAVIPLVARMLLIFEMLGAAILVILFVRSISGPDHSGRAWSIIRVISWLWIAASVLSLIGATVGYVNLANLLGDAALGSAYLAVILYAAMVIVSGLIVISLRSRPLSLLKMVRQYPGLLLSKATVFLQLATFVAWVLGVLASLSVASVALDVLKKILSAQGGYGSLHLSLGHVLAFATAIWLSFKISRFLRFVLEEDVYDRFSLSGGIPYAISKILNYLVLLCGFFIGVSLLGYDLTQFTILAGAFGVGLGFGMQNIVNNFVSGLILLFERPVKVGDVIQMGDTTGVVSHIGIRASVLRTSNSAEIIVPNGNLISSQVTNWTLSNRQRGIEMEMNLGADADPARVLALLITVASANPRVTKMPAPQAFLTKFSGDSFSYQLHAWTEAAEQWVEIRSELAVALNRELTKEHIAIK